jgi:type II secretory pathway component PulM
VSEPEGDNAEVQAIAMEIEQYLDRHPRSKDNLEGIRMWWLTTTAPAATIIHVERALERLVAQGAVVKESMPDQRIVYASARKKADAGKK